MNTTSSVQERLKLKRITLDTWSTKEKLSLASSVLRSGDQNWSCVSRSIKAFGEPNRPQDWFSQKNCAQQYASLLENVETPKRKKRSLGAGEKLEVETPGECIVKKLSAERIEELKKIMLEEQANYLRLKDEINALISGQMDEKLDDMLLEIEEEKKQKEREKEAHVKWLREREERRIELERAWKPGSQLSHLRRASSMSEPSSEADSPLSEPLNVDVPEESVLTKPTPTSPLLTSLLKSPSATAQSNSILHSAITSPHRGSSPTIASLLSSAPGLPGNLGLPPTSVSSNLKNLVSNALSGSYEEHKPIPQSPSQGAPTLSMLLELPPSMPGKPLPMLQTPPAAPPPYSEHLGPPPPYSQATEYLQKQRAAEQLSQVQSALQRAVSTDESIGSTTVSNASATYTSPNQTSPISSRRLSSKTYRADTTQIEVESKDLDLIKSTPTKDKESKRVHHNTSDHDYIESPIKEKEKTPIKVEPKPAKVLDTDVFEFDEKKEGYDKFDLMMKDSKLSYLKSNNQRQTKKDGESTSPRLSAKKDNEPYTSPTFSKTSEPKSYLKESEKNLSPIRDSKTKVGENEEDVPLRSLARKELFAGTSPRRESETETEIKSPRFKYGGANEWPLGETDASDKDVNEEAAAIEVDSKELIKQSLRSYSTEDVSSVKEKPAQINKRKSSEVDSNKDIKEESDITIEKRLSTSEQVDPELDDDETKKTDYSNEHSEEEKTEDQDDSESAKEEDALSHLVEIIKSKKADLSATEDEKSNDALPRSYGRKRPISITYVDSVPNSPGPSTEEEKEFKAWKKSVLLVYTRIAGHRYSSLFLKPISDDVAPGYSSLIFRPMDLSSIKKNIEIGAIRTTVEFQRDVNLMFQNAIMYNKPDGHVYKMAQEMQADSIEHFQILMQATEKESAPSRRETRTQQDVKTRTQEKGPKPSRSSVSQSSTGSTPSSESKTLRSTGFKRKRSADSTSEIAKKRKGEDSSTI